MAKQIYPNVGDILLHKKGGYYRVLMYGMHTENQEKVIVYESLETKSVWVRPLTMFKEDRFTVVITAEQLQS